MEVMKECDRSTDMAMLMSLALDGLLDVADRQRLERHLETCTACRAEWEAMQTVSALFEQSTMVGPPLGFAVRVERRLGEREKKRRRAFGGVAVLTSSLSLAGLTVAAVTILVLGVLAWQWLSPLPGFQQGTEVVSKLASGAGLMGRGASFFLGDLLLRYGTPLAVVLILGVVVLVGVWTWFFVRRPGGSRHNGYA